MRNNAFGWAEWSGTSFAAPKVAGRLAAHLLAGQTMAEAEANMRDPKGSNLDYLILSADDVPAAESEPGEGTDLPSP